MKRQFESDLQRTPQTEYTPNNASRYCDYNEVFADYDQIRQPHGFCELMEIFKRSGVPLGEQTVLEGGFGTGAYLNNMRHRVRAIFGVEGSDRGYQQTRLKLKNATNVHVQLGNILSLPFRDNYFNAYMVNQVLHHLDAGLPFPQMDVFLTEAHRVLTFGGHLTITTCTQAQLDPDASPYWHYKYIQPAVHDLRVHYIPIEELERRLHSMGFTEITRTIPSGKIFAALYYEDPRIVFEPGFRRGDSVYSFLSAAEIQRSHLRIRAAIDDGSVYDEMKCAAERRAKIGEALIVSARKGA